MGSGLYGGNTGLYGGAGGLSRGTSGLYGGSTGLIRGTATPTPTPTPTPLVAIGSTILQIGDGIAAETSSPSLCNGFMHLTRLLNMRLQPVALPLLAQSGSTIFRASGANQPWVNPTAIDVGALQDPDVVIIGSMGANDDLLATDPGPDPTSGNTTSVVLQDWYDAIAYAKIKFPSALIIGVTTLPSDKTNETTIDSGQTDTRRKRNSDAQLAYLASQAIPSVDLSGYNPTLYNETTGLHVHPKQEGGYVIGLAMFTVIDPLVEAATAQQVRDMIQAGTYPLMGTAQLDTDHDMVGSGGTVTGLAGGSTAPTSKLGSTTIVGVSVASAVSTVTGARQKDTMTVPAGTISTAGRVLFQDKANVTNVVFTPGSFVMTGIMFKVPAGLTNIGSDYGSGYTTGGGGALVGAGTATAPTTYGFDSLWFTQPVAVNSTSQWTNKRSFGAWYALGAVTQKDIELQQPFYYLVDRKSGQTPAYLGETKRPGDGLYLTAAAQRLRPTGTVSAASGGTVRIDPGLWHPQGLGNTEFVERRLYKGNSGNTGVGTGTLIATISGSTWTYAVGAGATTAGDLIYAEVDAKIGAGATVTARSVTTITVGA